MTEQELDLPTRLRLATSVIGKQVQAARAIGISAARLSNYLRGHNRPPVEIVERLAAAAHVRLAWLRSGTGPMFGRGESPGDWTAAPAGADEGPPTNWQLCELVERRLAADPHFRRLFAALVRDLRPTGPQAASEGSGAPEDRPGSDGGEATGNLRPVCAGAILGAREFQRVKPERRAEFAPYAGLAAAGPAFRWTEDVFPPREAEAYVHVPGEAPGRFVMRVDGPSMEPDLPANDLVLIGGRIEPEQRHARAALAVYEDDNGDTCYTVKLVSGDKDHVRLRAVNGRMFGDVTIARDRLRALYAVIGPIRQQKP